MVASVPAAPRHTASLLRLLPSGPDRVHSWLLRGDRYGRHNRGRYVTVTVDYDPSGPVWPWPRGLFQPATTRFLPAALAR